ncbi:MAG: 16S rRNA (cytidine(1402)-2'-O)-methyltransferase [Burkholderiales bacterium]
MAEKIHTALYVVATPIGNLRDITLRALDVLKAVDVVAAEDTRKTRVLLEHYSISPRLIALHAHNENEAGEKVIALLQQGKSVALVSDAGTPGISDPGAKVSARVRQAGFPVVPLPGANAALAAFSASGLDASQVAICGFLPRTESQRRTALEGLKSHQAALIFYEAPHRIVSTVNDMAEILGEERSSVVARELTKIHESFFSGTLREAKRWLQEDANNRKGEFVVIVEGEAQREQPDNAATARILKTLADELPLKQAATLAAEITGLSRKKLYALGLELKNK